MRVTLQPSGAVLEILPGERILDGARRLGYECPQSCRNGNCHVCAALLVEGRVEQAGHVRDHGEFYTCIAEPLEDCIVLWDGVLALGELPVRSLSCQVIECRDVGGDTWRVRLRAPAGKPPRYHAGQYLMIERENGEKSAFSLASAPHAGRDLEIHVLARESSALSLIEQLQRNPHGAGRDAVRRYPPGRIAGRSAGADRRWHRHGPDPQPDRTLPGRGFQAPGASVLGRASS